jgi:hypothetical protein
MLVCECHPVFHCCVEIFTLCKKICIESTCYKTVFVKCELCVNIHHCFAWIIIIIGNAIIFAVLWFSRSIVWNQYLYHPNSSMVHLPVVYNTLSLDS